MSLAVQPEGSGVAGGELAVPAVTFENVAVAARVASRLVTASPTYTVELIDTVTLPIVVQVVPLAERDAVNVLPTRASFSQTGATPAPPLVRGVAPATLVLYWKPTPFAGVTRAKAYFEAGASD